jgi:UDP-glucose 4-epimerase
MHVLVTGGLGYIGSHTTIELLNAGHSVLIVDNLSNSKIDTLEHINSITTKILKLGSVLDNLLSFIQADIRDRLVLDKIFFENDFDLVMHFAGLKAVSESVEKPLKYYDNNVNSSIVLFNAMEYAGVKNIIFSSSATVYGVTNKVPIKESFPLSATNPYGRSKIIIEDILRDLHYADPNWSVIILRYFNPVGAHKSGLIGDKPNGIPNNLMPYISMVAAGELEKLSVFGCDYLTPDGSGIRDYIHVVDLAKGHISALDYLLKEGSSILLSINLGTGNGFSVLKMISTFELVSGQTIPFQIVERRKGDVAESYTDPSYAKELFDWQAELNLNDMCRDSWNYKVKNSE